MAHNRGRTFTRRTSPPNRGWAGTIIANRTAETAKLLIGAFELSNDGIDETVLRTVGSIMLSQDGGGSQFILGAFGMIVVSESALAAGSISLPGPITDIQSDGWFVHVPVSGEGPDGIVVPFNSKAKRVIHDGSVIALMWEGEAGSSDAARLDLTIRARRFNQGGMFSFF